MVARDAIRNRCGRPGDGGGLGPTRRPSEYAQEQPQQQYAPRLSPPLRQRGTKSRSSTISPCSSHWGILSDAAFEAQKARILAGGG